MEALFYVFAVLILAASVFLVLTRNIVHAAFSFMAILLGVVCVLIMAHAEFVAVTYLVVYVGGIVILILFGVMLTQQYTDLIKSPHWFYTVGCALICLTLFSGMVVSSLLISSGNVVKMDLSNAYNFTQPEYIGYLLLTKYSLPFEVSGILLLVSLIGAAFISSRTVKKVL